MLELLSVVGWDCVKAMSYGELHRQVSAEIEAEREAALARLGPSATSVRAAVTTLLEHRTFTYPLSVLPMIVHAAETGLLEPALPLAVIHELWWTSACYLDDLADGQGAFVVGDLTGSEAQLAAVISGTPLPLLVVQSPRIPEPVRGALSAEIVRCWIVATEGQLSDLRGDAGVTTRDTVITAYRGKSGAPFSMVTAMAAELAGAAKGRVELWREFGNVFGVLWQIFNDQEDILSGRNEDVLNGTVTYLLACAVEEAEPESKERVLGLHSGARNSHHAPAELIEVLLAPAVLRGYEEDINKFRDQAHRILGELGGDEAYVDMLRDLVDQSSRMLLKAGLVTA
ncbi:polyprenyl synthetase family protein [Streptomyces albiflavescens]|nr:polyprenyl synthetase family protein [Streptomyces albiflavescens]